MLKLVSISIIVLFTILSTIFLISSKDTATHPEQSYLEQYKENYKIFNPPIPSEVNFAGENANLNIFYIKEDFEKEILVNTYWHSSTLLALERANRWFEIIEPILKQNKIPNDFKYLAVIESNLSNITSTSGAKGFWQLLKSTAEHHGLEINDEIDERYNVQKATQAACDYLNESYNKFHNWTLVAASYNMGMSGVANAIGEQKTQNFYDLSLNQETSRYIYRILAIKTIFENPSKYGFQLRPIDLYPTLKTTTTNIDTSNINLADFAIKNNISYKMLKTLNPWLLKSTLTNANNKKYTILLPKADMYNYSELQKNVSYDLGIFGEQKNIKLNE